MDKDSEMREPGAEQLFAVRDVVSEIQMLQEKTFSRTRVANEEDKMETESGEKGTMQAMVPGVFTITNGTTSIPDVNEKDEPLVLREGEKIGKTRVATLNVGTMTARSCELVEALERRRVDFCAVQETRWSCRKSRDIGRGFKDPHGNAECGYVDGPLVRVG
ncbi:unnamed protein product [Heligmosomoides polygyrus]|uniref:Endo/exonuclease/phosphatase domain-containing protein n=1 Tax=Heligmosomoides polygyrus TaxID=6339 RepID=A0A3P8BUC8_HELPZ|nr:unnamed protein product [Heligmosomoides polygyrus]